MLILSPSLSQDVNEEEELRLALAMSTADSAPSSTSAVDSDFVNQLLGTVDQSDPLVAAALAQLSGMEDSKEGEKKEGEGESKSKDEVGPGNKRKGEDI